MCSHLLHLAELILYTWENGTPHLREKLAGIQLATPKIITALVLKPGFFAQYIRALQLLVACVLIVTEPQCKGGNVHIRSTALLQSRGCGGSVTVCHMAQKSPQPIEDLLILFVLCQIDDCLLHIMTGWKHTMLIPAHNQTIVFHLLLNYYMACH